VTGQHPRLLDAVTIPIGPQAVQVGGTTYYVPKGAGVAPGPSGLVYVLFAARVHCLGERGEISIPDRVRGVLASHYFGAGPRQQASAPTP